MSEDFITKLSRNFKTFKLNLSGESTNNLADVAEWYSAHATPLDSFFTVCNNSSISGFKTLRWVSVNALDQKFQNMFLGSSTQQRILAN